MVRLYRILLRLYPRAFRDEFGPHMVQFLRDRLPNSQSGTVERLDQAVLRLPSLSGRYIGEMEQVAETFAAIGLTPDIHKGAADLFRLLNASPLATERREEIDPDRTTSDVLRMLSNTMSGTSD